MGEEVIHQKDFSCPCGEGILHIEVREHDTWASGRHSRWELRCEECQPKYRELRTERALVSREHYDEIEKRGHELFERRRAIGQKAAERYLTPFRDHVKSLKFMTSMHDALGRHDSIQTFRKKMRSERSLDDAIEETLKYGTVEALKQIKVEDAEIADELAAIGKGEADLQAFIDNIPKHPIPNIGADLVASG